MRRFTWVLVVALAWSCAPKPSAPEPSGAIAAEGSPGSEPAKPIPRGPEEDIDAGSDDDTAMFVHVEGPLDELRGATMLPGIEFQRRLDHLDGGLGRAYAFVTRKSTLEILRARGLVVRVSMDEAETTRRIQADYERMQGSDAAPD